MNIFLPRPFLLSFLGWVLLLAAPGCSGPQNYSGGGSDTYTNPVYAANLPDPSVKKFGRYYYAFATTGDQRLAGGCIFASLRSRDLAHWERLGGALVPPFNNAHYAYWAPEIAENHGKYYL